MYSEQVAAHTPHGIDSERRVYDLWKVLLVCDQWALAKICVADAERTLCALKRVVLIPALVMANSSHFANVDDWTGWYRLVVAINNLAGRPPSALLK